MESESQAECAPPPGGESSRARLKDNLIDLIWLVTFSNGMPARRDHSPHHSTGGSTPEVPTIDQKVTIRVVDATPASIGVTSAPSAPFPEAGSQ